MTERLSILTPASIIKQSASFRHQIPGDAFAIGDLLTIDEGNRATRTAAYGNSL